CGNAGMDRDRTAHSSCRCQVRIREPDLCFDQSRSPCEESSANSCKASLLLSQKNHMKKADLDQLCINTIRTLSLDAVQKANSGHPGLPLGMAPAAYVLWTKFLSHNPKNPKWFNRDRFVLSGGHGSMLIYSLLHLTGYDLSLDELQGFGRLHTRRSD